jgi:hypothetical protein
VPVNVPNRAKSDALIRSNVCCGKQRCPDRSQCPTNSLSWFRRARPMCPGSPVAERRRPSWHCSSYSPPCCSLRRSCFTNHRSEPHAGPRPNALDVGHTRRRDCVGRPGRATGWCYPVFASLQVSTESTRQIASTLDAHPLHRRPIPSPFYVVRRAQFDFSASLTRWIKACGEVRWRYSLSSAPNC